MSKTKPLPPPERVPRKTAPAGSRNPSETKVAKPQKPSVPSPAKPATKARKTARSVAPRPGTEKRREEMERLHAELAGLRGAFVEVTEQFSLKLQGRITKLQGRVMGLGKAGQTAPPLPASTATQALALLAALKLKPRKGRLKDLAKIAEAVDLLRKLLMSQEG